MPAAQRKRNPSKRRWLPLLLNVIAPFASGQDAAPAVPWHSWSADVFTQAAREHRFVLLNLQASWCRWCGVMDRDVYGDDDVRRLIDGNYVAVRVEQSSRPDLANRYKSYDLPTTVIFGNDGVEIARTQGFRPPARMASLLQAVIDDPSPAPSVTAEPSITYSAAPTLPPDLLSELERRFSTQYELPDRGLAFAARYVDADFVDYATELAQRGDEAQERRVSAMLRAAQALRDPDFGGMYQSLVVPAVVSGSVSRYERVQIGGNLDSEGDQWNEPHFEKLLSVQAQSIRMYASAYAQSHRAEYLAAAESVHGYVRRFLASPDGAFYTSQAGRIAAAGDSPMPFEPSAEERSRPGLPVIDRHQYARENGWMIVALCALYAVSGDVATLGEAEQAARWIVQRRRRADGGFAHDELDPGGPYLGDTLAAGEAFLALYEVTADRRWLQRAEQAAGYIAENFSSEPAAGFVSSKSATDPAYPPHADREENAHLARFANLLAHYTGCEHDARIATHAMRYLATRQIALAGFAAPVLLAQAQYARVPGHVVVVGAKKDAQAQALFRAALGTAPAYRQLEWFEPAEAVELPSGIRLPKSGEAAAFVCNGAGCSSPISDPYVFASLGANAEWGIRNMVPAAGHASTSGE